MDWSLLGNGLKLMFQGMGVVYIFLVIMILAMDLLKRLLAPFADRFEPKAKVAPKKKSSASGDEAQLAAIAAAAVAAARSK